jgi:hypothetical protein
MAKAQALVQEQISEPVSESSDPEMEQIELDKKIEHNGIIYRGVVRGPKDLLTQLLTLEKDLQEGSN